MPRAPSAVPLRLVVIVLFFLYTRVLALAFAYKIHSPSTSWPDLLYDTQGNHVRVGISVPVDLSFADPSEEGTQGGGNEILSMGVSEDVEENGLGGRRITEGI